MSEQSDALLALIPVFVEARREADEQLRAVILAANKQGASWARIGKTLGTTRQAAWERYGRDERTSS